jgi:hypothetical protein
MTAAAHYRPLKVSGKVDTAVEKFDFIARVEPAEGLR